jgi:hypothetical protein
MRLSVSRNQIVLSPNFNSENSLYLCFERYVFYEVFSFVIRYDKQTRTSLILINFNDMTILLVKLIKNIDDISNLLLKQRLSITTKRFGL